MRRNWPQAFRAGPTEVGHALEHSMNIKGGQARGNETGPSAGAADTAPASDWVAGWGEACWLRRGER